MIFSDPAPRKLFFDLSQLGEPSPHGSDLVRQSHNFLFGSRTVLQIGDVERFQISPDANGDLLQAPLKVATREFAIARADGLELGAIECRDRVLEHAEIDAHVDELRTYGLDCGAVVHAEIRNRLEVRREPTCQSHHFDVSFRLALEPPTRLHAIEIAVKIQFEQRRGMIGRSARCRGNDAREPQGFEVQALSAST